MEHFWLPENFLHKNEELDHHAETSQTLLVQQRDDTARSLLPPELAKAASAVSLSTLQLS
jgi:hypothetical protein